MTGLAVAAVPPVVGGPTVAPGPPPSAYPDPITLPVSPKGDPDAARALAAAYRDLAGAMDTAASQVSWGVADLTLRWRGAGSRALHTPTETLHDNLTKLAAAARQAADHLDEYAAALHRAQHHHGWSLGKFVAVGAIVAVTAIAVVVTVGAAAPVGTLAAVEVGEAIAGAEAAAGAATAAETAATTGLTLAGQTMTALRTLTAVALPHLTNGAISTTIDVGFHLATGSRITPGQLAEAFAAGTLMSATTTATRTALHATEAYRGASAVGRAALDTAALTATLTTDDALSEYATSGHLNPTALTEAALLTAVTGGAAALRNPTAGTAAISNRSRPPGQTLADVMANGVDPALHEGLALPWGHAIAQHVGRTEAELRVRLLSNSRISAASTFTDVDALKLACDAALRSHPAELAAVMSGAVASEALDVTSATALGIIVLRSGRVVTGYAARVVIVKVGDRLVIRTAFVEKP